MSKGTRIPLQRALEAIAVLDERISPHIVTGPLEAVGSVRRHVDQVGDLELIAPMPGREYGDDLCRRLAELLTDPDDLFSASRTDRIGSVISGLKLGFRACSFTVWLGSEPRVEMPVQIYRYDPGAGGNRGMVELIRTGPVDFGKAFLARWKVERGIGSPKIPACRDSYLLDANGRRVPTPTEVEAMKMARLRYIDPEERARAARTIGPSYQEALR